MILLVKALQPQVNDTVKGVNPTTHIRICSSDDRKPTKGETARMASGRVGRIWKGLLPQLDGGVYGVELDVSEKVFPCPRNP